MKLYSILFILIFFVSFISAQTSKDFDDKYEKIKVYKIRPDIIMTSNFNDQGQVCVSKIEKYSGNEETVHLNVTFSSFEIKEILNEIIPESQRGNLIDKSSFSMRYIGGEIYFYKNVTITYYQRGQEETDTNIITVKIEWKNNACKND